VKTSLRRPYCLSKKRKKKREKEWRNKRSLSENLSEALRAGGKGENLSEAPLPSF
jgi:hypothetical protein